MSKIYRPISLTSLEITKASTLDTIIALGQSGFENLKARTIWPHRQLALVDDWQARPLQLSESYRQLFLPDRPITNGSEDQYKSLHR